MSDFGDDAIFRCESTGKLFFNTKEMKAYAEAFNRKDFTEIPLETQVHLGTSGKFCLTEHEIDVYKKRNPTARNEVFEKVPVTHMRKIHEEIQKKYEAQQVFMGSVDQELLFALENTGVSPIAAARALHFTYNKGLAAARKYLEENPEDLLEIPEFQDGISRECQQISAQKLDLSPEATENAPEVKQRIDSSLVAPLVDMGFSLLAAERALLMVKLSNQCVSVEAAVHWLGEHMEDPDLNRPVTEIPPHEQQVEMSRPKLTKEEAVEKAKALQAKLRAERECREAVEARQAELDRVASTKRMLETRAVLESETRKREIEATNRERKEAAEHKALVREKVRQDYIERYGMPPPEDLPTVTLKSQDQVKVNLGKIKKVAQADPVLGKKCLTVLSKYIQNLLDNPENPKFSQINRENAGYQSMIQPVEGAEALLKVVGFEDEGNFLKVSQNGIKYYNGRNILRFIDLLQKTL